MPNEIFFKYPLNGNFVQFFKLTSSYHRYQRKHSFHVFHTRPAAREYVGHTRARKFSMHNLQCQTNCLVSIDVKNVLKFQRKNALFKGAKCYV